jgi:hypothetical protein
VSDTTTLPPSNGKTELTDPRDLPDKPIGKFNLRSHILGLDDKAYEDIHVTAWDVTIRVTSMTGKERARMLKVAMGEEGDTVDMEKLYPLVVIATAHELVELVDEKGNTLHNLGPKLFSPEDVEALNAKSAAALEQLATAGLRLSGMDARSNEKAGKAS